MSGLDAVRAYTIAPKTAHGRAAFALTEIGRPTAALLDRGEFSGQFDCPRGDRGGAEVQFFGMLPDGSRSPRIVLTTGSEVPVRFANNVFATRLGDQQIAQADQLRWETDEGTFRAPIKVSAPSENCSVPADVQQAP